MIPQIAKRQIGKIAIVDVKGPFTGPWALKGREILDREMAACKASKIIFNMRPTANLDTVGARSLFESVPQGKEVGVLCGKADVMDIINRLDFKKEIYQFHDEKELIDAFGEDLVDEPKAAENAENRISSRLQTALDLDFYYETEGDRFKFKAIITNLSESGLFAEYIDLENAEESLVRLNPYDFNTLHLSFFLSNRKKIEVKGNVVHRRMDGEQVGIGIRFIELDPKDQTQIKRFLKFNPSF